MTKDRAIEHGRWVENVLALGGGALLLFAGFKEAIASCSTHPFPWAAFIIGAICVAPKTLGRATAGRIWGVMGARIPKGEDDAQPPV